MASTPAYWTGPAWGGNAEFLAGAAQDPARPGKWKGETDYYGDCDLAHDPDCDGFYDVIPTTGKKGSDNCPGIYNPAQLPGPANDAGVVTAPSDIDNDGIPDYCDLEKEKPSTNADVDHNGLDDQYQPCPLFVPMVDSNGNGIPDCKDLCATATTPSGAACAAQVPNGDADCDGICDEQDNCPGVANTDQANCNAVSENAHGARALGDVCDPVPCPMFEPQVVTPPPACTYDAYKWSCLTKSTLTGLSFSPIGSFGTGEAPGSPAFGGVEVPTEVPSTRVRYCVSRVGVKCEDKANVTDALALGSLGSETASSVYWRVSVDGDSPLMSGLPQRTYSATQPPEQVSWDYEADFAAWQASNYPVPLLGVASGTTYTGRLWFHADTSVGMAGAPTDVAAKTGIHAKTDGSPGEQLANHYSTVFPSQLKLEAGAVDGPWPPIKVDVCIGAECNAVPNTPIKDCIACNVLNPALVAPRPGDLQLVVDIPGLGLHGLTEAGGYAPVANPGAVSAELGALLALGGKQVTAVEPVRLVGRSTSVPQSLFLSTDGVRLLGGLTVLGDTVTTTQAARQLLLGGRRGEDATGATLGAWTPASVPDAVEIADGAPAPAAGVAGIPVYSATLGQFLLVRSGGGAAGTGELWRRDIRSPGGWQQVALGTTALGTVKAATYTYADGAMWVLDEVRGPLGLKQARLVRIGLEGEGARVMASWPKLGVYDTHWLLVDRDGGLVLVASSSKTLTHVAAKLRTTGGGLHLSALRFAPGSLALPPVIDRNGFRFFVKRHKTDHLVETTRLASLAPATLSLSHVGGCF